MVVMRPDVLLCFCLCDLSPPRSGNGICDVTSPDVSTHHRTPWTPPLDLPMASMILKMSDYTSPICILVILFCGSSSLGHPNSLMTEQDVKHYITTTMYYYLLSLIMGRLSIHKLRSMLCTHTKAIKFNSLPMQ